MAEAQYQFPIIVLYGVGSSSVAATMLMIVHPYPSVSLFTANLGVESAQSIGAAARRCRGVVAASTARGPDSVREIFRSHCHLSCHACMLAVRG
jgi:hypothetical protein